jgi:fimbrial isopeptide formation D2 family protein/LPXTG-motif cell wall-anchored protein
MSIFLYFFGRGILGMNIFKRLFSKLVSLFVVSVLLLSLMVPFVAFADDDPVVPADPEPVIPVTVVAPSSADRAEIVIKDVEQYAVVRAYRVVEPVYNSEGLVRYDKVNRVNIADIERPTSDEVAVIVTQINSGLISPAIELTRDASSGDFKANVGAGEYVVTVANGPGIRNVKVYNPMVVSVNYSDANNAATIGNHYASSDVVTGDGNKTGETGADAPVSALTNFAYGSLAYAKSSQPSIEKKVKFRGNWQDGTTTSADKASNSTAPTDVEYKVDATVPSYAVTKADGVNTTTLWENLVYSIRDDLDSSFNTYKNLRVTVGPQNTAVAAADYTISANNPGFIITFKPQWVVSHGGEVVHLLFDAVLKDEVASQNFNENPNKVTLTYSNDVTDNSKVNTMKDVVYAYTFALDGVLDETGTETHELNKVTTEATSWSSVTGSLGTTQKPSTALSGAEFSMYLGYSESTKDVTGDVVAKATTDSQGHMYFSGLDQGTYYVKETNAPAGYTLNDNIYRCVITATLGDDGIMTGYTVAVTCIKADGSTEATKTVTYTNDPTKHFDVKDDDGVDIVAFGDVENDVTASYGENNSQATQILNTRMQALPSTGGAGTIAFVVAGVIIMIAGIIYLRSDKNRLTKKQVSK